MWKWIGLGLTLLIIIQCFWILTQQMVLTHQLEQVLSTQNKLDENIKYIKWVLETVPLTECNSWKVKK